MDNIAISWLGQSKSNPDVLYAATGENWIGSWEISLVQVYINLQMEVELGKCIDTR